MKKLTTTPIERPVAEEVWSKREQQPFRETQTSYQQRLWALIRTLRPRQWTKNFALFIGLVFAQQLFRVPSLERTLLAGCIFCLASSSIYILNDLLDLTQDRQHPVKRNRPLASGLLPLSWGWGAIAFLLCSCAALTLLLFRIPIAAQQDMYRLFGGANLLFTITLVGYLLLMTLYSFRLKHIVLVDVFVIAGGFLLRILAGAVVVPVAISPWLYLVTSFLSLFLALSKRRHELMLLQGQAHQHRQALQEYSLSLLDQLITIVVTGTILSYSLYTIEGTTGGQWLVITIPFVLYGTFRYLYLLYMRMEGGSPEEVLLRDRHILGTVIFYTILVFIVLYVLHM